MNIYVVEYLFRTEIFVQCFIFLEKNANNPQKLQVVFLQCIKKAYSFDIKCNPRQQLGKFRIKKYSPKLPDSTKRKNQIIFLLKYKIVIISDKNMKPINKKRLYLQSTVNNTHKLRNCNSLKSQIKQVNFMFLFIIKFKLILHIMIFENKTSASQNTLSFTQYSEQNQKTFKSSQIYSKKWTVPQNILYARYLKTHMSQMTKKTKKKCGKFVKMANFIGSKTQNQCRSHHQKMMNSLKSFQNIIKYANEIQKRGQAFSIQEFIQNIKKGKDQVEGAQRCDKMEEQISTQRQQSEQRKQEEKDEIEIKVELNKQYPINEQESHQLQYRSTTDDIFDVLEMDVIDQYGQYFKC